MTPVLGPWATHPPHHSEAHGKPRIFVSHGTDDEILPIDRTSRRLVPQLKQAGYAVEYREFAGPHTVPAPTARAAVEWMTGRAASPETSR
jgi:predicted esterase